MKNKPVNILLIEDSPEDAVIIREMLRDTPNIQFKLKHANKLKKGFEMLFNTKFDVLLLDLNLPDSWGFDTFIRTYDQVPDIPIVILSGFDDEEIAVRAVREGAQDYMIKGEIDGKLLSRSIYYAIERKEIEKELMKTHNDLRKLIEWHEEELIETEEKLNNEIKAHKETEKKLIDAIKNLEIEKNKFNTLIDQLPHGIIIVDAASGSHLVKNKKFEEISDGFLKEGDMEDIFPFKGFYPDGTQLKTEDWPLIRSIVMGEEIEDEKIAILKNDGTTTIISTSSKPIRDNEGQIIMGMSILSDITDEI